MTPSVLLPCSTFARRRGENYIIDHNCNDLLPSLHLRLAEQQDLQLGLAKHQDPHLVLARHEDPHLGLAQHEDSK